MTVSDETSEDHSDRPPPPPRFGLFAIVGTVLGAGVVASEVLWPHTAAAIHDGLKILSLVILSARRKPRS